MNYELCKLLKDAGFPQEGKYRYGAFVSQNVWVRHKKDNKWFPGTKEQLLELRDYGRTLPYKWPLFSSGRNWDWENYVYNPHLDELIEAIGDRFLWLKRKHDEDWKFGRWYAEAYAGGYCHFCDTPEEAVAYLWLELNKK